MPLSFFFWQLYYLFFFDLRILNTPVVSSDSSFHTNDIVCLLERISSFHTSLVFAFISLQSSSKFNTLCFNGYFQYSRNEMFLFFFWWMSFVLFVNNLFHFTITCFVCQMNCLFYKCCLIRLMFVDFVDDLYFWRFPCSIEIIILLEIEATYHIYYDESPQ